ncbi:hypothetical protein [Hyphomicrobium sp. 99]|uniref:hypothetical protein n=1 Tax=Hyphomicrobium sp. 99 TaxID=1163419 RepID=UPI0012DFE9EA|nr:hypothetical protein [Hyphomicrobium sp. 99]
MRSATSTTISSMDTAIRSAQWGRSTRFIGIAIASLGPAIFWCLAIQLAAYGMGISLSTTTIGAVFATIALFLFAVCAPIMLRKPTAETLVTAPPVAVSKTRSGPDRANAH